MAGRRRPQRRSSSPAAGRGRVRKASGAPSPARPRRLALAALGLLGLAVGGAGAALWWARTPVPEVPVLDDLSSVDPMVARAIDRAVAAVRRRPRDGGAYGGLARVYHASELADLAARCYQIAASLDPATPDWPDALAMIAARRGDTEQEISFLRRAVELSPGYAPTLLHLGNALLAESELDDAEAAYLRYHELAPRMGWGQVGLGKVARRRGRLDEAARHLEAAAPLLLRSREARYLLATTYRALGRGAEADGLLAQLDTLPKTTNLPDPRRARVQAAATGIQTIVAQANAAMQAGDMRQAEHLYHTVLASDSNHFSALTNLGNLCQRQQRYAEAARALERAIAVDPDQPTAHVTLARVYVDTGRFAEAEEQAAIAVKLDPSSFRAHYYVGWARLEQRRFAEAIEPFREAIERKPDFIRAHYLLAGAYAALERKDEAIAEFSAVLRLAPDHVDSKAWLQKLRSPAPAR